jgi:thiamine biosynthesis lipoprotein
VNGIAVEHESRGGVSLALEAMATRFELVLHGGDAARLRAAGEEALAAIAGLERQLSFYRASSDVSWINARAAHEAVRVEPGLFALLHRCRALSADTDGAFDITVAPLMRAWGFVGASGTLPGDDALAAARAAVGSGWLQLDAAASTVRFLRPGMSIDLGAAGKGHAVDVAMDILRDHAVPCALLHGGTSSVHVLGTSPGGAPWRVGWSAGSDASTFELRDSALAVSAVKGKSFVAGGREYGHVIDPRTGVTTAAARAAAVTGPSSLDCDALSTALLVLGPSWLPVLRARFPGCDGAVV